MKTHLAKRLMGQNGLLPATIFDQETLTTFSLEDVPGPIPPGTEYPLVPYKYGSTNSASSNRATISIAPATDERHQIERIVNKLQASNR
jgi:hypothetical protein